jgi:hypothetical protein
MYLYVESVTKQHNKDDSRELSVPSVGFENSPSVSSLDRSAISTGFGTTR